MFASLWALFHFFWKSTFRWISHGLRFTLTNWLRSRSSVASSWAPIWSSCCAPVVLNTSFWQVISESFFVLGSWIWTRHRTASRWRVTVLNAAAHLISDISKYQIVDCRSYFIKTYTGSMSPPPSSGQRLQYKLAVTVHRCLQGVNNCTNLPRWLLCPAVCDVAGRHHLRSAAVHQLTVPRSHRSSFGSRAFASLCRFNSLQSLLRYLRDPAVRRARSVSKSSENILVSSVVASFHERIRFVLKKVVHYTLTYLGDCCQLYYTAR